MAVVGGPVEGGTATGAVLDDTVGTAVEEEL